MLILPVGDADIVAMLDAKPKVVLRQSVSVASPPLLTAIARVRKSGAEVKVLLGPKPDYEVVKNQIMIGSRPYAFHAGAELGALKAADVPIYINPNFNELRGTEVVPGAASHASYLVTDTGASIICTGTWSDVGFRQKNICLKSEDRNRALALTALHNADFDFSRATEDRHRREQVARKTLLVCPGCEGALGEMLTGAQAIYLRVSGLGDARELIAILFTQATKRRLILPAAYRDQNPAVAELAKLGTQVRYVDDDFDGLMIVGRNTDGEIKGLIGSLRLTQSSLRQSREVAAIATGEDALGLSRLWDREWQSGRP